MPLDGQSLIDIKLQRKADDVCADYDDDCDDVPCKLSCWLYDPERGMCPYLLGKATK